MPLAAPSTQLPQTPWRQLQSVQAPQSTSKPRWSSPEDQAQAQAQAQASAQAQVSAQAPQHLQGRFASKSGQQDKILLTAGQQLVDSFSVVTTNLRLGLIPVCWAMQHTT